MKRISTLFILIFSGFAAAQSPWPSVSWASADNLTAVMNANGIAELSGLHWNPETQRLYCVQGDGRLRVLQMDASSMGFTQIASKALDDGPEGITQVDFSANEFYTVDENTYEIRKFTHNAAFGNLTESRHWDLLQSPSPMEDTGNTGPEGIVFIPDSALSAAGFIGQQTGNPYTSTKGMGGLMFIAHQDEGYVWVFDINPNVSNDFAFVGKYKTSRTESADLAFDRTTGLLYILHNTGANTLEVTDMTSSLTAGNTRKFTIISEYFMDNPTDGNINIEGFAIMPKCGNATGAWLARDVEDDENDEILQDCLRWFSPFAADGSCPPLSVQNPGAAVFTVYPNPGKDYLTISFFDETTQVDIFNCLGQIVLSQTALGESVLDVSAFSAGVYFVRANIGGNASTVKWIKNN